MSEPVKLVIVVDGGLIQDISTCGLPLEVVVIDYDTDGETSNTYVVPKPFGDGHARAFVSIWRSNKDNCDSPVAAALHGWAVADVQEEKA